MQGTIHDILEATGGRLVQGRADTGFAGLSIDSRTIAPGEAFVAIHGEVHDGHAFLPQVLAGSQASGVVVAADRLDAPGRHRSAPTRARPASRWGTRPARSGTLPRAIGAAWPRRSWRSPAPTARPARAA